MKKRYIVIFTILIIVIISYIIIFSGLPGKKEILNFKPRSTVLDFMDFNWHTASNSVPIQKFVPLTDISNNLRIAVVISEDDIFYRHHGINFMQLKLALQQSFKKRRFVRGASTITMQLARNAFLTKEKSIIRKIREIILARRIEKVLSKSRILELYLNIVEWGPNIYGAEAASWYYFDKPASMLDLAEASLLAAILPNPIRFNPYRRFNSARKLQYRVLHLMRNAKVITPEEMEDIYNEPLLLRLE